MQECSAKKREKVFEYDSHWKESCFGRAETEPEQVRKLWEVESEWYKNKSKFKTSNSEKKETVFHLSEMPEII